MRIADRLLCAALVAAGCVAQITAQTTPQTATRPQRATSRCSKAAASCSASQNDITKVVISEPKIADAVVISPREVMVNAKGAGPRHAGDLGGRRRAARYEIDVTKDTAEWDAFTKSMQ